MRGLMTTSRSGLFDYMYMAVLASHYRSCGGLIRFIWPPRTDLMCRHERVMRYMPVVVVSDISNDLGDGFGPQSELRLSIVARVQTCHS